ncbi:MAG TPA: hypothetical protein VE288_15130 [Rubrobacteraceae bacterium]|nr:hypothetical protein [Rubrobacteraceae bacterium]
MQPPTSGERHFDLGDKRVEGTGAIRPHLYRTVDMSFRHPTFLETR